MNEQVKAAIKSVFGTDSELEKTIGVVIDYGALWFRIKRAGGANKAFGILYAKRLEPFRAQLDRGNADEDALKRMMAEVYADTIVIDYGLPGPAAAPYSTPLPHVRQDIIDALLSDDDMFFDLQMQAKKLAHFKKLDLEADAKNSEPVCDGSSSTQTKSDEPQSTSA